MAKIASNRKRVSNRHNFLDIIPDRGLASRKPFCGKNGILDHNPSLSNRSNRKRLNTLVLLSALAAPDLVEVSLKSVLRLLARVRTRTAASFVMSWDLSVRTIFSASSNPSVRPVVFVNFHPLSKLNVRL